MYWDFFLIVLVILAILDRNGTRFLGIASAIVFFIALSGNFLNGVDWVNYYSVYKNSNDNFNFMQLEPIFYGLLNVWSYFKLDFYLFIILCNFIIIIFMYKGICYFTKRRSFAILLFYLYLSLLMFSEQLRQAISFVIVLYSVKYILVGSRLKFLSLIGMASLFHVSAVFGIIIMFYNHIRITIKHLILYLIAAISFNLLLPIIYGLIISALSPESTVSIKLNTYSDLANASPGVGFFVVFDIFWIYMLYLINAKNIFDTKVDFLIKISIVSCFFHIIFYSFPPLQRLFSYLFFAQILLTVNIVKGRVELEKLAYVSSVMIYVVYIYYSCMFGVFSRGYLANSIYYFNLNKELNYDDYQYKRCMEISKVAPDFCLIK